MKKVIVVGGGWAGCASALQAVKSGAQVTLLERTDMLLGTGLVGGIMRNNGRLTAALEMAALGGGDLFDVISQNLKHQNISFPGHEHADLYHIGKISGAVTRLLRQKGVEIHFETRIAEAAMDGRKIQSVTDAQKQNYEGDMFIDTTGTAGPIANCTKYGNGCAMCVLRCPAFGGRVSLTALAGVKETVGKRQDGRIGAMSGACKLYKESLAAEILEPLNRDGVVIIPVPEHLKEDHGHLKSCQQYALDSFTDNIILLDTGHAKLMTPFSSLERLQQIPGFENARFEDPYAGSRGNSMRFFAMSPRDDALKVSGVENLFCAGEKAGLLVGHTEAIVTGVLAGYNSVRELEGQPLLELPSDLAVGDAIRFVREEMATEEGICKKYTFSGSVYFARMQKKGLYLTDPVKIRQKVKALGLEGIFEV